MFRTLPLERVLLETDAPFLTPSPFRGKVNMPSMVREVAKYNAEQRNIDLATFIATTAMNAQHLFHI
jgi:TatD DNase family protein